MYKYTLNIINMQYIHQIEFLAKVTIKKKTVFDVLSEKLFT